MRSSTLWLGVDPSEFLCVEEILEARAGPDGKCGSLKVLFEGVQGGDVECTCFPVGCFDDFCGSLVDDTRSHIRVSVEGLDEGNADDNIVIV